jgi:hypothetical protein
MKEISKQPEFSFFSRTNKETPELIELFKQNETLRKEEAEILSKLEEMTRIKLKLGAF